MKKTAQTQLPLDQIIVHQDKTWRLLELVPGLITWFALIIPIIGSLFLPHLTASIIIIYTIIWLFRSFKLTINLYRSYQISQKALKTNWEKLLNYIEYPKKLDYFIQKEHSEFDPIVTNSPKVPLELQLKSQIEKLKAQKQFKKPSQIWQAILYVTYKESYDLIRESIKSYVTSNFDPQKIILVFACEEADRENAFAIAKKIQDEFAGKNSKLGHFMVTLHPKNLPGEIKGKSANATWAAKELKKYLDKKGIDYEDVIVSNFDADTVVHPEYFNELTYKYLTAENRTKKAYQPTHFFHNNIWDVPIFTRMVALSCTFWRMAESMEKNKYKSFSSRSLSFKTAVEVNYWDPAVIPEDSRQYWTAYLIYNADHELVPIYTPVYMDAVLSESYLKTFESQYKQLRRWAWGVCDFPFVAINLWRHPKIKTSLKIHQIVEFLKNSFFWATGPILITFTGFLPGLLNRPFSETVLAYNLPHIMSNILTLTSSGILMCTILSLKLVPYNSKKGFWGSISLTLQWLLVPIVSIILSAIPAMDAQTRLLFNKKLEYQVTQKTRK